MIRSVNDDSLTDEDRAYAQGYMHAARASLEDDDPPQPDEKRRRPPGWVVAVVACAVLLVASVVFYVAGVNRAAMREPLRQEVTQQQDVQQDQSVGGPESPEPTTPPVTESPEPEPEVDIGEAESLPNATVDPLPAPLRTVEPEDVAPADDDPAVEVSDPQPSSTTRERTVPSAPTRPDPEPVETTQEPEPEPTQQATRDDPEPVETPDEAQDEKPTGLVPGLLCALLCWG